MRHVAFIIACAAAASLCWSIALYARREMLVGRVFERAAYSSSTEWRDTASGPQRDAVLRDYFYSLTYAQQRYPNGQVAPVGGTLRIYQRNGAIAVSFAIVCALVIGAYLLACRAMRPVRRPLPLD